MLVVGVLVKYSLLSYPGGNASPFCGILKLNIKDLSELRTLGNSDVRWPVIKGGLVSFCRKEIAWLYNVWTQFGMSEI